MDIKVKYDGAYPNLCSGNLAIIINNKEWIFPDHCLESNGDWDDEITNEKWSICIWPKDFPANLKSLVEKAVNNELPQSCCGGCIYSD